MLLHLQPSRLVLNTRAYILSSDVLSVQFSPKPLTNRNIAVIKVHVSLPLNPQNFSLALFSFGHKSRDNSRVTSTASNTL